MCTCMPFFPVIVKNSPALQKCIYSVASLASFWTLRSSGIKSANDGRKSYQEHMSHEGSIEDGLELDNREAVTDVALSESPRKTPRMELEPFKGAERPKTSYTKL